MTGEVNGLNRAVESWPMRRFPRAGRATGGNEADHQRTRCDGGQQKLSGCSNHSGSPSVGVVADVPREQQGQA